MRMNQEIKAKWVEALRSGKYNQGHNYLAVKEQGFSAHCCLGVLCDLAKEEGIVAEKVRPNETSLFFDPTKPEDCSSGSLPHCVRIWAGIGPKANPVVNITTHPDLSDGTFHYVDRATLAELNDNEIPFETIAQIIEEQL